MTTALQACRYVVRGRVQGVGFRWFVRQQARARGLAGFVQNAVDGSVVAEVRGRPDLLRALEVELRQGPSGAHVERVERVELEIEATEALPSPFEIRRWPSE